MAEFFEKRRCIKCEQDLLITEFAKRYHTHGPWVQSHCTTGDSDLIEQEVLFVYLQTPMNILGRRRISPSVGTTCFVYDFSAIAPLK